MVSRIKVLDVYELIPKADLAAMNSQLLQKFEKFLTTKFVVFAKIMANQIDRFSASDLELLLAWSLQNGSMTLTKGI